MSHHIQDALRYLYDHYHGIRELSESDIDWLMRDIDESRVETLSAVPFSELDLPSIIHPKEYSHVVQSTRIVPNYFLERQDFCQQTKPRFANDVIKGNFAPQIVDDMLVGIVKMTCSKLMLATQTVYDGTTFPLIKGCFYDIDSYNEMLDEDVLLEPHVHKQLVVHPHRMLFTPQQMVYVDKSLDKSLTSFKAQYGLVTERDPTTGVVYASMQQEKIR